jgi:hypothetical protein
MLLINPIRYAFLFLFAPLVLLIVVGIFGLIRLIIKEYSKKDEENKPE